jgi:hypothetical protein
MLKIKNTLMLLTLSLGAEQDTKKSQFERKFIQYCYKNEILDNDRECIKNIKNNNLVLLPSHVEQYYNLCVIKEVERKLKNNLKESAQYYGLNSKDYIEKMLSDITSGLESSFFSKIEDICKQSNYILYTKTWNEQAEIIEKFFNMLKEILKSIDE